MIEKTQKSLVTKSPATTVSLVEQKATSTCWNVDGTEMRYENILDTFDQSP